MLINVAIDAVCSCSSLLFSPFLDALREVVRHSHLVRTKVDHVIVHQGEKGDW